MMSWTDLIEKESQQLPEDPSNVQILQSAPQPTTIFQLFSEAVPSPFRPERPGHIREDLVELMMMQNAQMHQIIMNNMSVSALNTFNYTPETARINMVFEEEPDIYHHYYPPVPGFCYPGWVQLPQPPTQVPSPVLQNSRTLQEPPQHAQQMQTISRDRKVVPPTPPPSAQTVDADIPLTPE
ncbi:proline-rich protein 29-like [Pseudorasbora parva]|uniref:proline-rich protein 29-like n=1 Tax=Pseudorasbora parva TaxID=51549 RepID=UPI00351E597F